MNGTHNFVFDYSDMGIVDLEKLYNLSLKVLSSIDDVAACEYGGSDPFYTSVWRNTGLYSVNRVELKKQINRIKDHIDAHYSSVKRVEEIDEQIRILNCERHSLIIKTSSRI